MYSTFKRHESSRFHVASTWNTSGMFGEGCLVGSKFPSDNMVSVLREKFLH